ncbi:restriction endonuclease [Pseudomonas aeruginosa]|uniref:restriction endonuclease subunit S n=1 Tax=Pseudomonas aeruginosa TaxID=287 RepID=UPI000F534A00|nr:restriction endonuclease subunit S [Pseudomonas aeruginosa]RQC70159.1 restriction endonuclease [Pseudomonas aeruginosa]
MNKHTIELLEKHFDTAFVALEGIKKLRELILTLAMQGKLVPQDPNEQPASELLQEIEAEKQRLVKEGKIKKPKPLPPIREEEKPYSLPQGWEWARLQSFSDYNGRPNIDPSEIAEDTWLLDLEDIEKETSRLICRARYFQRESKSTKSTFKEGDVLYGKLRPYLDKVLVADSAGVCTTEIVPIVPSKAVIPDFLRWLLKRPDFLSHVNTLMYGVKMPRLGTEDAIHSVHPIPPVNEQHRIIAKINELMARCDELEKLCAAQQKARLTVHTAAIKQLLNIAEPDQHQRAQAFLAEHFGELYIVKENVAELRKAILQLAVMGKLVLQGPNDQPASELLKEIEAEKQRLVKEGKIKKPKPLPPVKPEEVPYALPQGWEWVRLGDIGYTNIGLTYSPADVSEAGIPVLRSNNIKNGKLDLSDLKRVQMQVRESTLVHDNDLLICARNGSKALVGKTALITDLTEPTAFGAFMAIFRSRFNQYLLHFINSPLFRNMIDEVNTMTINQITQDNLRSTIFPLPPLAAQRRIVAQIEQLMKSCDSLDQKIDATTTKQAELLSAVIAQA